MAKKTTKKAASKTTGRKSTRKAASGMSKAAKSTKSSRTATKKRTGTKRAATTKGTATKRTRKAAATRELIDTGTDKRYVRRGARGQFKESDDVGRSLASDRRKKARTKVKSGQGDRGDQ